MDQQRNLDRLSDQVREFWIAEHRAYVRRTKSVLSDFQSSARWDGGRTAGGVRCKPIWPKVAAVIANNGLDPRMFVAAQFQYRTSGPPPTPNIMLSQSALERYNAYVAHQPDDLLTDLKLQVEEFNRCCRRLSPLYGEGKSAITAILADRGLALSALFRYCIAFNEGLVNYAAIWQDPARTQYHRRRPQYDEVWGDCIPEHLRSE